MVGNILVAHGMRKGNQNKALEEFITTLLKDEEYHYELAFLESDTQSLEITMEKMIEKAEAMAQGKPPGVRFNLPTLDKLIGTVQKGHLCVVGGRPGSLLNHLGDGKQDE